MRIRMIGLACGPDGNFYPGQEYEVPPDVGAAWCEARLAVPVGPVVERAVSVPVDAEVRIDAPKKKGKR